MKEHSSRLWHIIMTKNPMTYPDWKVWRFEGEEIPLEEVMRLLGVTELDERQREDQAKGYYVYLWQNKGFVILGDSECTPGAKAVYLHDGKYQIIVRRKYPIVVRP